MAADTAEATKGATLSQNGNGRHRQVLSEPFRYVHVFAANSQEGIERAQRVADELAELEGLAPRPIVHALEGDLNWLADAGRTLPFLWHPPWGTDILATWDAVQAEIQAGRAILLEDALASVRPSEHLLLDIKQGTHPTDAAMRTVRDMVEHADLLDRVAIVSYSSETLLRWSHAFPSATRVLHTLVMRGPRGVELRIAPTWTRTLLSFTFGDILALPHVDVVMRSFGSAPTQRTVRRLRHRCLARGKQYWAGKLRTKRAVHRAYLGADGGYIWNARAARKALHRAITAHAEGTLVEVTESGPPSL